MFSTSVSIVRGYYLVRDESFLSYYKGMFETLLFFCFNILGEDHVASWISDVVLIRLGVSEED